MQALILAGGLGTRLRASVKDKPKPMAPVNCKPFLQYQLMLLKKYGITDIVLSVGYKAESIIEYFGDGSNFSVKITYSKEAKPLGTGGAIKNSINLLGNDFLLLNGDSIILTNPLQVIDFHHFQNSDLTIVLTRLHDCHNRYGIVSLGQNMRVTSYTNNGGTGEKIINAGMYVISKYALDMKTMPESFSFEKELLPALVKNHNIYGFESRDYFIDIGTPNDYLCIQKEYTKIENFLNN